MRTGLGGSLHTVTAIFRSMVNCPALHWMALKIRIVRRYSCADFTPRNPLPHTMVHPRAESHPRIRQDYDRFFAEILESILPQKQEGEHMNYSEQKLENISITTNGMSCEAWTQVTLRSGWGPGRRAGKPVLYPYVALFLGIFMFGKAGLADPTVSSVTITFVRIYSAGSGSAAMLSVAGVPSTFCNGTPNFSIALSDAGGQGMLAAAMPAVTTGQTVSLEVSNATGCTVEFNWGPQLQSMYLNHR
jgi:hypothetical protein